MMLADTLIERGSLASDAASSSMPGTASSGLGIWGKLFNSSEGLAIGSQNPKDAIEYTTVVYPRHPTRLVGQHRFDGGPFVIGEFVAHDSGPQLGL